MSNNIKNRQSAEILQAVYRNSQMAYEASSDVLKHCSRRTLWRTFDSCNNYKVPEPVPKVDTQIHYWCAKNEKKERKQDIAYMKRKFPQTEFIELPDLGHGGLVLLKPELFSKMICELS